VPHSSPGKAQQGHNRKGYSDQISSSYTFALQRIGRSPRECQDRGRRLRPTRTFPNATIARIVPGGYSPVGAQAAFEFFRHSLLYRASVNILIRTKGIEFFSPLPDSCHNPIAVLAGGLRQESQVGSQIRHRWSYLRDVPLDSTSAIPKWQWRFVMGIPAVMVDE